VDVGKTNGDIELMVKVCREACERAFRLKTELRSLAQSARTARESLAALDGAATDSPSLLESARTSARGELRSAQEALETRGAAIERELNELRADRPVVDLAFQMLRAEIETLFALTSRLERELAEALA